MCDAMLRLGIQLRIGLLKKVVGGRRWLHVATVIDESGNRNPRRQLRHAAVVIAMPERSDQGVDPGEAGILGGGDNPFCVTNRARSRVAGVDEQRFTRW